jgi:hypothetical protein
MAFLNYGTQLCIRLDDPGKRQAMEAIASHASRGGWVTVTDVNGQEWSILVTAGVPVWVSADE